MKNLLFVILFLSSVVLKGQNFSIGMMGGAISSSVHKSAPNEGMTMHKDNHLSFAFGVNAELRLFKNFFGVLEANYERKGFAEHYFSSMSSAAPPPPGSVFRVDEQQSFSYLSFPILLRHKWGNKMKVFGSAGFSPSFLIGAETSNSEYNSDEILTNNTKHMDVSGIVEAGVELNLLSNISLCSGLRYNRSFICFNRYPKPIDGAELSHKAIHVYGTVKYYIK